MTFSLALEVGGDFLFIQKARILTNIFFQAEKKHAPIIQLIGVKNMPVKPIYHRGKWWYPWDLVPL